MGLSTRLVLGAVDLGDRADRRPDAGARPVHALGRVPLVLFLIVTNFERWRVGRYFWNKLGLEYTLMWLVATVYFLINGGGFYSLDRLIGWEF